MQIFFPERTSFLTVVISRKPFRSNLTSRRDVLKYVRQEQSNNSPPRDQAWLLFSKCAVSANIGLSDRDHYASPPHLPPAVWVKSRPHSVYQDLSISEAYSFFSASFLTGRSRYGDSRWYSVPLWKHVMKFTVWEQALFFFKSILGNM